MKNTLLYQSALVLGFLVTAYGCNKPPEYPIEPKIEFKDIESYPVFTQGAKKDSLIIVTRFEDGDGDLGALHRAKVTAMLLLWS